MIPATLQDLTQDGKLVFKDGGEQAPWWRWHGGQISTLSIGARALKAGGVTLDVEVLQFTGFGVDIDGQRRTLTSPPPGATAANNYFGGLLTAFADKPAYDQVVIGHAARSDAEALARLLYLGGGPTAPFAITRDGRILQLYDPDQGAGCFGAWTPALASRQLGVLLLNHGHAPGNPMEVDYEINTYNGYRGAFRGWRFFESYPKPQRDAAARLGAYLSVKYGIPPLTLPPAERFRAQPEARLEKAAFRGFLSPVQLSKGAQSPETPGLWDVTGLPPHWDWDLFLDQVATQAGAAKPVTRAHHKQEAQEVKESELEGEDDEVRARLATTAAKPEAAEGEPAFAFASYRVASAQLGQLYLAEKLPSSPGAATGQLDPSLSSATKSFQTDVPLDPADGGPGPATRKALRDALRGLVRNDPTQRETARPHILGANWGPLKDGKRALELTLANVSDGRTVTAELFAGDTKVAVFEARSARQRASFSLPVERLAKRHPAIKTEGLRVEAEVRSGTLAARRKFDSPGTLEASSPFYGGFQLRLGDRDKDRVWGGKQRDKQGAFVAELQKDLATLGYWVVPYATPTGKRTPARLDVFSGVFDSLTRAALFAFQWEHAPQRNQLEVVSVSGRPEQETAANNQLQAALQDALKRHDGQLSPATARELKDAAQRKATRPSAPWTLMADGGALRLKQLPPDASYWLRRKNDPQEWLPLDTWLDPDALAVLVEAARTWSQAHPAQGDQAVGLAGLPMLHGKGGDGRQWDVVTPHLCDIEHPEFKPENALRFARHWLTKGVRNLVFNCAYVIEPLKRWAAANGVKAPGIRAASGEKKSGAKAMQMRSDDGPQTGNRLHYCVRGTAKHPSRDAPLTDEAKLCPHVRTCPLAFPSGKYWSLTQGDKNRFLDGLLSADA